MPSLMEARELSVSYHSKPVLSDISLSFLPGKVTAVIGPSGCGKTTLLRSLNRLSEITPACRAKGKICLDGTDIHDLDPMLLRRRVGMVFQKPNPFPKSIWDNVLYGVKASVFPKNSGNNGHNGHNGHYDSLVQSSLEKAVLWDEVKDRLKHSAYGLSQGQQQRLCIARTLATSPEVVLLDEPASSLDPTSTYKLESSILAMKGHYTVVIVTHNMQQARRIADYTAFLFMGRLVEFGETGGIFEDPQQAMTKEYVSGKFG